jgi:hypothetical protein
MSMPNVALPWSVTPPTLTGLLPESAEPDVASIATALRAAGFVRSAIALTDDPGDAKLQALATEWRQTTALDEAMAGMIARGSGPVVPSVSARSDGSPRFVVRITDADAAAQAIAREHGDDGVSAELRLFLDEVLRSGDRYVDAAPGDGFAALTAASGEATVSVIVLCDDNAQSEAIDISARWSGVADCVTARASDTLDGISFAPAMPGATTILHAGSAASVAALMIGARSALERREIGAVAWRCGRADETGRDAESLQIAAAVLGVFGFVHFALASGEHGMELVPADAMASNEMIFSLEPSYLARFAA